MKNAITIILVITFVFSDAFSAPLLASDIDPTSAIEQISLIVASIVSFLAFIMGSKRVLKFLG